MADKILNQGETINETDQTLYLDLGNNIYARVDGATLLVGRGAASSANPVPVYLAASADPGAITLQVDALSDCLVTMPIEHYWVHRGRTFQASYKSPDGSPIADDANLDFLILTGVRYAHLVFEINAGGIAEVLLYEGTTASNYGTLLTSNNMQRYSAFVATTQVTRGPIITGAGTLVHNALIPGGSGPGQIRIGGTVRSDTEWILQRNSIYLLRGINRSGGATPMSGAIQWYEMTEA